MKKIILLLSFTMVSGLAIGQTAPIKKKNYVDEQRILNVEAATPRTGYISAPYRKADGNWYEKTDAGVEQLIIDTVAMLATKYDLENVSVDTVLEIATKYDLTQLKYFTNIAAIPTTLELGERIKIEDTGAEYFVQNTTVAGFNGGLADGVAVIDLGGSKYAVLQTNGDEINMSWFRGTDYAKLDTASLFCAANDTYNYVLIDYDTITLNAHSLLLRKGCVIKGTNNTGGTLNGTGGTVIISNFNDITKPTFITDSIYVSSYHSFTGIRDVKIEATSNALCAIRLINPERNVIENIEINGDVTNRYFKDGFIISGSIHQSIKGLTILGCEEVAFHTKYYNLIGTTTNLDDCWFKASGIGIKLDSNSMNLVLKENTIELIDSSSIIAENNGITVTGKLHIEDASQNGNSNVIQLGLMEATGAVTNSSYFEGLRLSQNPSNIAPMIYSDKVSTLSFINSIFRSGSTTLGITDNINAISFENCIERGVTNTAYDFIGMPDSSKITMINHTEGVTSIPKSFFGNANLLNTGIGNYITKYNSTGENIEDSEIFQLGSKIGIGLIDPVNLLQLYEPTGAEVGIRFGNVTTGKTVNDGALFGLDNGEDLVIFNYEDRRLSLGTNGLSRMTITESGNWGNGTGNANYPSQTFRAGSGGVLSQFTNGTTGSGSGEGFLVGIDSGENGYLWNQENEDIIIGTNNIEKVRIFSDGTLRFSDYGSGTITGTPAKYLAVESDGDVIEVDAVTSNLYTADGTLTGDRTVTMGGNDINFDGGNVGIGTSTPSAKLDIVPNSLTNTIRINTTATQEAQNTVPFFMVESLVDGERFRWHSDHNTNFFLGRFAGQSNVQTSPTSGQSNFFLGQQAGQNNTTGYANYLSGNGSGLSNISGSRLTGLGYQTLQFNTTGNDHVAIGTDAGYNSAESDNNIWLGFHSGRLDGAGVLKWVGDNNTLIGSNTGTLWTTGADNTFIGNESGYNNTSGSRNSYIGNQSAWSGTTGLQNIAIGDDASFSNVTGSSTVAIGYRSMYSSTVGLNTAVGTFAGFGNVTGTSNVFQGYSAGENSTGGTNTLIGYRAGASSVGGNVMLGYRAGDGQAVSNELWIDNSNTATPLIHGDFSTNILTVNGSASITGSLYDATNSVGTSGQILSSTVTGTDWIDAPDPAAGMDAVVSTRSYADNTAALVDLVSGQVYYNTTSSTFVVLP